MKTVAVIGAGAAGCFCAIEMKRRHPDAAVTVFEAGPKALAKVAVTGGGRCNFTNTFALIRRLEEAYPRGAQLMKRALRVFSQDDVMAWFEAEGVPYVVQEDQCVFPASQDAMQIVRTLERLMRQLGVVLRCRERVESLLRAENGYVVNVPSGQEVFDCVVVTTGGGALKLLEPLGLAIEKPVPSLFTLKVDDTSLRSLMGLVVPDAALALAGTPFRSRGALLLTDWGVSGPATLKLSSYAARWLSEAGYCGTLMVNWLSWSEQEARAFISSSIASFPKKLVLNVPPASGPIPPVISSYGLSSSSQHPSSSRLPSSGQHPSSSRLSSSDGFSSWAGDTSFSMQQRLWRHLVAKAGLREDMIWSELGSKGINRLVNILVSDEYPVTGRCHFKSEFVTCGGVSLTEVSLNTLESKRYPGLFFAGEVLDVDAVTGGFNLQAAWSTAMVVASSLSSRPEK